MSAPVQKVVAIPELAYLIMGYLEDRDDLLSACLTSRAFYAGARPHLWRDVRLPRPFRRWPKGQGPFHERFSAELATRTRSLFVDGHIVAGRIFENYTLSHLQWYCFGQDFSFLELKADIDKLFDVLEQTLMRTPLLRNFSACMMPRSLDLIILLQRHSPKIESIQLAPCFPDRHGLMALTPQSLARFESKFDRRLADDLSRLIQRYPWHRPTGLWRWQAGARFTVSQPDGHGIPPPPPAPGYRPPYPRPPPPRPPLLSSLHKPYRRHRENDEAEYSVFPFANVINLNPSPCRRFLAFDFPNLATLSLFDIPFCFPSSDTKYASAFVDQLVSILKASPNLKCLELSAWWINLHPQIQAFRRRFLPFLCQQYQAAGGRPLTLQFLKLHHGSELVGDPEEGKPHYLARLTQLARLQELHLLHPRNTTGGIPASGFVYTTGILQTILNGHLPRLRRLSLPLPWHRAHIQELWQNITKLDREHAARLTLNFCMSSLMDVPLFDDSYEHVSWLGNFAGLVLPSPHFSRMDAENFIALVPSFRQTQSIKTRLPCLNFGNWKEETSKLVDAFARVPELSELWLTPCFTPYVPHGLLPDSQSHLGEARIESLATKFAAKCAKLVYLRIDGLAWRIPRGTGEGSMGNETGRAAKLDPLTPWEVENKLPDAFDFRTPRTGGKL
ncbi:hypothetical protein B0H66DRAFT_535422 [Apodospora peruviana]|uniref:F-box domain-containing protein n=1 Tax=Apodospora peruviana TaxID=516989 RepID=A0AAE0M0F4_9PEZI|nr:hypothetical protein B0H66DRAFT_535422 [Apodospora peruviana]